ncbi:MAG: L,D-transpeptidase family protein [Oscillospiraceae bacterium]
MATKVSQKKTTEKNSDVQKKKKNLVLIFGIIVLVLIVILGVIIALFSYGNKKYSNTFLPNTTINGVDVSGKTLDEAKLLFSDKTSTTHLNIEKRDNTLVTIPTADFDYKLDTLDELSTVYARVDHNKWFNSYFNDNTETFTPKSKFDTKKLTKLLKNADWGKTKNSNAKIVKTDSGFEIKPEVYGDNMNRDVLIKYIIEQVSKDNLNLKAEDSGCYIDPEIKSEDLKDTLSKFEAAAKQKININFDYTKETLNGSTIVDMIEVDSKGNLTANRDKVMAYVEKLAKKYDTYNTERKFHATLQGDIIIPTSSDAKYGWWIDQEKTCDLLCSLIKKGKDVASVDPIYYADGNYVFTGVKSARTANDDIGKTYIEIDLTAQHLWYYKNGKKVHECDIVSGQTTSEARTTLPGVYKVWQKATDYEMKGSNSDGDKWNSFANYWTRVAIVGIGLHDSTWRNGYFGGEIYKYNGSHGCINMTLEDAKYVYDNVPMGTPVVMYYKSAR